MGLFCDSWGLVLSLFWVVFLGVLGGFCVFWFWVVLWFMLHFVCCGFCALVFGVCGFLAFLVCLDLVLVFWTCADLWFYFVRCCCGFCALQLCVEFCLMLCFVWICICFDFWVLGLRVSGFGVSSSCLCGVAGLF